MKWFTSTYFSSLFCCCLIGCCTMHNAMLYWQKSPSRNENNIFSKRKWFCKSVVNAPHFLAWIFPFTNRPSIFGYRIIFSKVLEPFSNGFFIQDYHLFEWKWKPSRYIANRLNQPIQIRDGAPFFFPLSTHKCISKCWGKKCTLECTLTEFWLSFKLEIRAIKKC